MHAVVLSLVTLVRLWTPADTLNYVVVNHGREAGAMQVVAGPDSTVVRFHYVDRNRGPRVEERFQFGASGGGAPTRLEVRGLSADLFPQDVSERFTLADGVAKWTSPTDSGSNPAPGAAFYRSMASTPFDDAALAAWLLHQPGRSANLLPAGRAGAMVVADTVLALGGESAHVRLVAVEGLFHAPVTVWLNDQDVLFSTAAEWFVTVRKGWEPVLPALRRIEYAWKTAKSLALARRLTSPAGGPTVVRNGDLFDSQRGVLRPRTTVVITGDRITAVGPADSIKTPAGATVIDATGKTVLPGMWDMHTHLNFVEEEDGALQLAAGITTVRDMASDLDDAVSHRERADAGALLAPREILAGFMEGPGAWAGPTSVLVRTEADARAWIARYDSLGYKQIKLYNLVHPDLIPAIAAETHKRGMRLSGHVVRGLSLPDAVLLGYDEIQHAAFLFSTFFQDSLYVPRMRAYSQVAAAVAPTFNVDGPELTALLSFLRVHGTVIDGTFNVWVDRSRPLDDGTDVVFGPTLAWLPAPMRRELTPGGGGSPQDAARAAASSAAYMRLLKRLYDAGVTLVAGTDNLAGLSYQGELEIYQRAGIPAPAVLQIATIVAARVMKEDKDYGSVEPGKVADLVIVAGRPTERIADIRKAERVIRAGRVYSTRDLYGAVGVVPQR